jgi:hypothetical protein
LSWGHRERLLMALRPATVPVLSGVMLLAPLDG